MNDKFLDKFVACYLNNILIFLKRIEEYKEYVKLMLQKL